MNIFVLLIVGLVAGFLADKVVKNTYGLLGDMLIGVAGSFIGGWIFGLLGLEIDIFIGQIISAFIGAVLLLLVINYFKKKK
jgi:uncharacterized membrane protein YeaQ/YmgE (transglycosylase-associated protein family)